MRFSKVFGNFLKKLRVWETETWVMHWSGQSPEPVWFLARMVQFWPCSGQKWHLGVCQVQVQVFQVQVFYWHRHNHIAITANNRKALHMIIHNISIVWNNIWGSKLTEYANGARNRRWFMSPWVRIIHNIITGCSNGAMEYMSINIQALH